jgi:hypothetical protein
MWQIPGILKIDCDFAVLGKVIRNKGRFLVVVPSEGGRWVVVICLTLITSKPRFTSSSEIFSAGVLGEVTYHCFYGLLGLRVKRVTGEVIVGEIGFDGFEIRHAFGDDCGFVSSATELKVLFDYTFQLFCN